ncbi:hypothetical protein GCM10028808_62390 [Spirosoma migulaei]
MRFCKVSLGITFILFISTLLACQKNVDPKTPEQILTGNPWKIDELRYLQNNIAYYYKRGVSASSLSDEYIEFYSDNTGKYRDHNAITVALTWNFIN